MQRVNILSSAVSTVMSALRRPVDGSRPGAWKTQTLDSPWASGSCSDPDLLAIGPSPLHESLTGSSRRSAVFEAAPHSSACMYPYYEGTKSPKQRRQTVRQVKRSAAAAAGREAVSLLGPLPPSAHTITSWVLDATHQDAM